MKFMVAFSSPKRSAKTVDLAGRQAKAMNAELFLLRIIPDPEKVGVVAQLISTERPIEKAQLQIDQTVASLTEQGIRASGAVKVGEVAKGIIKAAEEEKVDLIFVGTAHVGGRGFMLMKPDPIVHYLVDHCPISLVLVRQELSFDEAEAAAEE